LNSLWAELRFIEIRGKCGKLLPRQDGLIVLSVGSPRGIYMVTEQAPSPTKETLSIVFLGSFNPRIFHPSWFVLEGLVQYEQVLGGISESNKDGPVVTPDLSRCEINQDVMVECLTDRLSINATTMLGEETARTLSSAILSKLPHTPITAVGINHTQIIEARSEDEWHRIGDLLVPKEDVWSQVMENRPGMALVRVEEYRPGPPPVRVWATIEPVRQKTPPFRISIHTNWHTDIAQNPTDGLKSAEIAADFLTSQWEVTLSFGRNLAQTLFAKVRESSPQS